jgi:hypothetical protein
MNALGAALVYLGLFAAWLVALRGERLLEDGWTLPAGWFTLGALLPVGLHHLRSTVDVVPVRSQIAGALVGATLLQGLAIGLLWPALSDDVLRYRADARAWLAGRSPYAETPRELVDAGVVDADPLLPFQDVHALYLPTSQVLFMAFEVVDRSIFGSTRFVERAPASGHPWRTALPALDAGQRAIVWRVGFGGLAVLATGMLAFVLARRGGRPADALLFGWHPLVIVESGGMAHQDVAGAVLLLASVVLLAARRPVGGGVVTALAVLVKPIGGVFAAMYLLSPATVDRRRTVLAGLATGVVFGALVVFDRGDVGLRQTAALFGAHWEANGSVYALVRAFAPTDGPDAVQVKEVYRQVVSAGLFAAVVALSVRRVDPLVGALLVGTLALWLAPVAYPWYLIWMLVLVPLAPRWPLGLLVWAATAGLCHRLWHTPEWSLPAWVAALEHLPVAVALAVDARRAVRR